MILEALGDYLNGKQQLVLATNLFLAKMPDSPDLCVTIFEYEGFAPMEVFGNTPYAVDQPRVQIIVRAARDDYKAAWDKLDAVRQLVSNLTDITISGTKILRVASLGSSIPLGLDDKDRPRLTTNFQAFVERK